MVFYGRQEHVFLVDNWKVTKRINDPDTKNINKYTYYLFPEFDEENFPVSTSNEQTYCNVKWFHYTNIYSSTGWMRQNLSLGFDIE